MSRENPHLVRVLPRRYVDSILLLALVATMADTGGVDDAIDGARLGFANTVRRGSIAVVGASGTGMQEVTTIIHRAGGGISQALGCGGRDLSDRVGARTMVSALGLLGVRAGRRQHQ